MQELTRIVLVILIGLTLAVTISSCASILRGSTHNFAVKSNKPVTLDITGLKDGKIKRYKNSRDSMGIMLPRKQGYSVVVSSEGYQSQKFKIESTWDWGWAFWGQYPFFYLGWIFDIPSGAYYSLEPASLVLLYPNADSSK